MKIKKILNKLATLQDDNNYKDNEVILKKDSTRNDKSVYYNFMTEISINNKNKTIILYRSDIFRKISLKNKIFKTFLCRYPNYNLKIGGYDTNHQIANIILESNIILEHEK